MSQQPATWRGDPAKMQHCFWSEFKNGLGDIGLITKFKGTGDGFAPQAYGPFELEGFVYSAAQKTGKSGKQYYDIERRPKGAPAAVGNSSNDEGWKKGHAENIAMHKEQIEWTRKLVDAIEANTRQQKENAIILDAIRMHCETVAKEATRNQLKGAAGK